MNVPLLDLKAQYAAIKSEVDAAIAEVLESQHFILGPKVEQCEKAIAAYSNCSLRNRRFFRQRRLARLPDGREHRAGR